MSNSRYVIWNGQELTEYKWDGKTHDCLIATDGKLVSIQRIRQDCLRQGIEPIIYFSCQSGQPSFEINTPDQELGGLATYCRLQVLKENPSITIRELITRTNHLMADMGFNQVSEVVCIEDILDCPFEGESNCSKRPVFSFILDACRTSSKTKEYPSPNDDPSSSQQRVLIGNEKRAEFIALIKTEFLDARIIEFQSRSLEVIEGILVSAIQLGAIGALWNIFNVWVNRYANASIKITYKTENGSTVDVTYSKLTKAEAERILSQHPPCSNHQIKIILDN